MVSQKTKVVNSQGFHMRPASVFVAEMAKFDSDIYLVAGDKEVNAKTRDTAFISADDSSIPVAVIATNEELAIARDTKAIVEKL